VTLAAREFIPFPPVARPIRHKSRQTIADHFEFAKEGLFDETVFLAIDDTRTHPDSLAGRRLDSIGRFVEHYQDPGH